MINRTNFHKNKSFVKLYSKSINLKVSLRYCVLSDQRYVCITYVNALESPHVEKDFASISGVITYVKRMIVRGKV